MGEESTAVLVERARRGDTGAVDLLYARLIPRLKRWAHGRVPLSVRGRLDTDDLVQDAVVKTLARLDTVELRGPGAFYAYLRQVLLNRIRDEIRARVEIRAQLRSDMVDPGPSPLDQAIGRETLARYETALERLKECERDAVVGRVELGCSYEELMPLLGKPTVDAARMAVGRALVRLAKEMSRV